MPEGDTVWRTAQRLDTALAGRPIVASDLRWPDLATADLRDRDTLEVVSRGKHLLHRIEGGLTLHSHLRMEGRWRIEATATLKPGWRHLPDLRALVATSAWTALGLRLGELDLVPTVRESGLVGHLGPDLLDPGWDEASTARCVANLRARPVTLAEALLDQRNLAGLGTIWMAETLFAERVNPWAEASGLAEDILVRVVLRAHALLDQSRRHDVPSSTGFRRRGESLYVHGRSGRPCRRCGVPVRMAPLGAGLHDRAVFYCPACQGGLGPTDDDRPQSPLGARDR
ncbi:MAG: Fpg/Nei family DNA glycosylase [Intrasporangium sp.]|uniref:DNA-formamidopyrimidine glycosylase family protein n=1 Tax=Intrasporangium sp. TaxID=1925024 RepID=UPI00264A2FE9|nr:DNA-formamidopyrimidine glycosylase family protein [Intrasporangium sp.]MDN5795374.1 Fpg/Nei family DNA glycosylase [Intrasporangium sp.]